MMESGETVKDYVVREKCAEIMATANAYIASIMLSCIDMERTVMAEDGTVVEYAFDVEKINQAILANEELMFWLGFVSYFRSGDIPGYLVGSTVTLADGRTYQAYTFVNEKQARGQFAAYRRDNINSDLFRAEARRMGLPAGKNGLDDILSAQEQKIRADAQYGQQIESGAARRIEIINLMMLGKYKPTAEDLAAGYVDAEGRLFLYDGDESDLVREGCRQYLKEIAEEESYLALGEVIEFMLKQEILPLEEIATLLSIGEEEVLANIEVAKGFQSASRKMRKCTAVMQKFEEQYGKVDPSALDSEQFAAYEKAFEDYLDNVYLLMSLVTELEAYYRLGEFSDQDIANLRDTMANLQEYVDRLDLPPRETPAPSRASITARKALAQVTWKKMCELRSEGYAEIAEYKALAKDLSEQIAALRKLGVKEIRVAVVQKRRAADSALVITESAVQIYDLRAWQEALRSGADYTPQLKGPVTF
jgi:hypothetical protein